MKKLLLLTKTLLAAVLLMGGANSVWAATETVGTSANDQSYWSSFSSVYTLAGDGTINLKFKTTNNLSGTHYHTYTLVVNDGSAVDAGTEYFRMMDMHYVYNATYNSNTNPDVFALTKNHTMSDAELQAALNGASVDMTITRTGGNIAVSATITPINGTSPFTSTFNYLVNDATSDNFGAFLTVENAYVYDLFAVTTKTYDFTSMSTSEATTLTSSGTQKSKERGANAYTPTQLTTELAGNFSFNFVDGATITVSTDGMKHINSKNTGRYAGIVLGGLSIGDKVNFVHNSNVVASQYNSSGNESCGLTLDGTVLNGGNYTAITSNADYYATGTTHGNYAYLMLKHNGTISSITVKNNTSTNYKSLYDLWIAKKVIYTEAEASTAKTTFGMAIDAAKTTLDNGTATEADYADAIEDLNDAYDIYLAAMGNNTYAVALTDNIYGGKVVRRVAGITMTYGGTSGVAWTVEEPKDSKGNSRGIRAQNGANATVSENLPSAGTYFIFNPTVNGILTFNLLGYAGKTTSQKIHAKLSDGTTELKDIVLSDSYKIWEIDYGVLEADKTYYVYFTGGAETFAGISSFKYEQSVSATIGANGFTTFASPYPLDLTSATQTANCFTAYRASVVNDETATFKDDVDQTVVANTGILLKGTANAVVTIPVVASGTELADNALQVNVSGNTFDAAANTTYYGMNKDSDPLTFGTFNPSTVAIPANKAYLTVTTGGAAREIGVVFGDITGVENVEAAPAEAKAKEGKFIENGKLVIVKNGQKYNAAGAKLY